MAQCMALGSVLSITNNKRCEPNHVEASSSHSCLGGRRVWTRRNGALGLGLSRCLGSSACGVEGLSTSALYNMELLAPWPGNQGRPHSGPAQQLGEAILGWLQFCCMTQVQRLRSYMLQSQQLWVLRGLPGGDAGSPGPRHESITVIDGQVWWCML